MKAFIYKLLSKGLLILLLLVVGFGFYYRTQLFPQFFTVQPSQVAAETATVDSASGTAAQAVAVPLPAMPAAGTEPISATAGQDSDTAPVADPATPSVAAAAPQWPDASREDTAADSALGTAEPASGDDPSEESLLQARHAYWAGDQEAAIAAYQQAASARPDDPDVQGELGNIYFAQGNWEGAATAYLAAGNRLLERGDQAAARHLVAVLEGLNPEYARTLANALAKQSGSGHP